MSDSEYLNIVEEGRDAYLASTPYTSNPHTDAEAIEAWNNGWMIGAQLERSRTGHAIQ